MTQPFLTSGVTAVVGIESRGFLFGLPIAQMLRVPFVPARKPGKLPGPVITESFALEYGTDSLAIHADALEPGSRVLVVDDVLATGGTAAAACRLVERVGAGVVAISVLSELSFLGGRTRLHPYPVFALVTYDD
jgi:adenine phosphoribosyltransferase